MSAYPTTLKEDHDILSSNELQRFSNERNCVIVRSGEKEVAHFWIQIHDVVLPLMRMRYDRFKKEYEEKGYGESNTPLDEYIEHVVMPLMEKFKSR